MVDQGAEEEWSWLQQTSGQLRRQLDPWARVAAESRIAAMIAGVWEVLREQGPEPDTNIHILDVAL